MEKYFIEMGWTEINRKDIIDCLNKLYSPNLAPSDFHLFQSLQNSLNKLHFKSEDDAKAHLDQFVTSRIAEFWKYGIFNLPDRWQEVLDNNGNYILD